MSIESSYANRPKNNGKVFVGLILLVLGTLLLVRQFTFFFFPDWVFSWPMLLIVIGLFSGFKHEFKNPSWFVMVSIGIIFLSGRLVPELNLRAYLWPLAIMGLGIWLIIKRNQTPANMKKWAQKKEEVKFDFAPEADYVVKPEGTETNQENFASDPLGDSYLDAVSVFGGIKKTILSKDFKGGEIVNIFGGAELDFTRADINGIVMIDITQVFGGVKLLVPPHWQVRSDIAAIFAGIDDKRFSNAGAQSPDKILVLKGTSIFGGIDVRSF
jgi:predicted membrane protein